MPAPMIPKPPLAETAAANSAVATQAIPPWSIGYWMPSNRQSCVSNKRLILPMPFHHAGRPGQAGTKTNHHNDITVLNFTDFQRFLQGHRDGCRRSIPYFSTLTTTLSIGTFKRLAADWIIRILA